MFNEISTSLKANLYERISSPLLGSIIISWFGFNWDAVLYLCLSKSSIEIRLAYLSGAYLSYYESVWGPLLFGGTIALLYPLCSFIPFWLWEKNKQLQTNSKRKFSNSELLTVNHAILLKNELVTKDKELEKITSDNQIRETALHKKITKLSSEKEKLYSQLSKLPVSPESDDSTITTTAKKILNLYTNSDGLDQKQRASDLEKEVDVDINEIREILSNLVERGFLLEFEKTPNDDEMGYLLSESGRIYLGKQKSEMASE